MMALPRPDFASAGPTIRKIWDSVAPLPGGKALFSAIIGVVNPYTGSIGARFVELRPGHAVCTLRQHRRIENHLDSVHAIALINLAEVTSGLALMCGLPPGLRGIPVHLDIDYHRKARGTITAECRCDPPRTLEEQQAELTCHLRDSDGLQVATAHARWRLRPAAA